MLFKEALAIARHCPSLDSGTCPLELQKLQKNFIYFNNTTVIFPMVYYTSFALEKKKKNLPKVTIKSLGHFLIYGMTEYEQVNFFRF